MIIEIEALDTLFFRDGKPFSMGDDTWANGMFPPLPSVLYGAIRSAYLGQNDIPLDEIEEVTSELRIKNIVYSINAKEKDVDYKSELTYYPMPLDLVIELEPSDLLDSDSKRNWEADKKYYEKEFGAFDAVLLESLNDIPTSHLIKESQTSRILKQKNEKNITSFDDGMISKAYLEEYFAGSTIFEIRKLSNHFKSEPKIGISRRNSTHTTEEGNLYRTGMLRVSDIKIQIEFEGLSLDPKGGLLKLGGENKIATYICLDDNSLDVQTNANSKKDSIFFKIYIASPAIFDKGYYPTKIFNNNNVSCDLISCSVGKAVNVGGFDMTIREPKEMKKAVPAGSVYYYKLKSGKIENIINQLKEKGISEFRSKEGFGIAYLTLL